MNQDSMQTLARRVLFAPLDEISRTETVIDRLRSAITLGVLADGEQLPSEVDLARQFNVAPVTLRDALKVLRSEELVRTTRGRQGGTFVSYAAETTESYLEEMLLELTPLELRDLIDWQCAVSSRAGALAAERCSKHSVQVLAHLTDRLAESESPRTFRRTVSRFFIELAAASQSTRLSKASIRLQVEFAPITTLAYRSESIRSLMQGHLETIAESVGGGNSSDAQARTVEAHLLVGDELIQLRSNLEKELMKVNNAQQ